MPRPFSWVGIHRSARSAPRASWMPRPFSFRLPFLSAGITVRPASSPFENRECHMSAIAAGSEITVTADAVAVEMGGAVAAQDGAPRRRGLVFWVVRYLPAEIVGTAAMVLAGLAVTVWTDAPALIALAALLGESIGFYTVLAITI